MASRRSRLQVKPNIGGPKAKAPPKLKIPDHGSKKLDCKYSKKNLITVSTWKQFYAKNFAFNSHRLPKIYDKYCNTYAEQA